MRRRILEALTYPRLLILDTIDLVDCPHDSQFSSTCDSCHSCDLQQECHWLNCINDFAGFANRPTYTMHASLQYSINLVEARSERMQHDSATCTCEACTWSRSAQQLTQEYQAIRRPGSFRPAY